MYAPTLIASSKGMILRTQPILVLGIILSFVLYVKRAWPQPMVRKALNVSSQSQQKRKVQMLHQKSMVGSWIHHDFKLELMENGKYQLTQKNMTTLMKSSHNPNDTMITKQRGYWWIDFNSNLKQSTKICLSHLLRFHCYDLQHVMISSSNLDKLELTIHNKVFEVTRFSK